MRPISQELCDRIRRLREHHSQRAVADIVHVCRNTVAKAEKRGFRKAHTGPAPVQLPADFAFHADKMSKRELRDHYGRSQLVIDRWVREYGKRNWRQEPVRNCKPVATPEQIQAAIAEHGVTRAADALGVHDGTLRKWRKQYGLSIQRRRKPAPGAETRIGWADRYFDDRRQA